MYLLEWTEGDRRHPVGIFDSLESGRAFMEKVPGYRLERMEEGDFSWEEESIEYDKLPDIAMIEYGRYKVPISRFSFESDIDVLWIELDHLDADPSRTASEGASEAEEPEDFRIAVGATRVDAYSINNEEVEAYVRKRESQFRKCVELLENAGFEVSRECFGSEDGEVLFIRKRKTQERWRFLTHMDPFFVEMDVESEFPGLLAE